MYKMSFGLSSILTKTDKFYIKINISFYLGSINLNFKNFFGKI
jgi:hypothetical protein